MQDKMKSLITNIKLDAATFHGETVDPTYINFFFGKNGAGKSTVAYAFEHPECLEWQNGVNPADYTILIYNQEFIDRNLANYGDLKGVFTLSEENAETRKQIDDKTEERKGVIADGKQAAEDRDKKSSELKPLRDTFETTCWDETEDILKSPARRIHKVKAALTIKETYTDEALEKMRDKCEEPRDLALIDMLASTGMRVGELVLLNRDDINFEERECVVFGKGSKERMVYFDARAKIHLQNYLQERTDDNPALFVSLRAPHERLQIGGVERRLRELGKKLDIEKVHPHKFRRTLATMAIDKGMPIEQLQQLLGHKRIDTTLQYAMVKQSNVKLAHRKYIG